MRLAVALALFLSLMFLFQPTYALTAMESRVLEDPASVSELTVEIDIHGTVNVDGSPTWMGMNVTIPQVSEYQDVTIDMDKITDSTGTVFGIIESNNPGNSYSYSKKATVKTRAIYTTSIPSSYTIPEGVKMYLQPTENIQSDDPSIKSAAESIVKDASDDFEKVSMLALWVNGQMTYDLSLSDKNYDAVSVLAMKRGVCAEYTTLFIALARSVGIPARFISAWAYGKYGWERHAYSEVYIGKWVPVDPLWMEIGYLDATHISFGYYVDNRVKNSVNYRGYGIDNINWLEDDTSISIKSYDMKEKQEDYSLAVSSESLKPGDDGVVVLKFIPSDYRVAKVDLEPCAGQFTIAAVDEKEKNVILRPNEQQIVYWRFSISDDLAKNYMYTCPMTLNSRSLALRSINLKVDSSLGNRQPSGLVASLRSGTLKLGQQQTVYITRSEADDKVGIITPNDYREWGAAESRDIEYSFTPTMLGEQKVVVYSSAGEVAELPYDVKSDLTVQIANFTVPRYIRINDNGEVSAYVRNSGPVEKTVRVVLSVDGQEDIQNVAVKDSYRVLKDVSFPTAGKRDVRLTVKSGETELTETSSINVFEEPEITYDISYDNQKGVGKVLLDVKKSAIKDVTIKLDSGNQQQFAEIIGKKEVVFSAPKGQHTFDLSYKDLAGKLYATSERIDFREENLFELIIRMITEFFAGIFGG
jgi:hypothetical protein